MPYLGRERSIEACVLGFQLSMEELFLSLIRPDLFVLDFKRLGVAASFFAELSMFVGVLFE